MGFVVTTLPTIVLLQPSSKNTVLQSKCYYIWTKCHHDSCLMRWPPLVCCILVKSYECQSKSSLVSALIKQVISPQISFCSKQAVCAASALRLKTEGKLAQWCPKQNVPASISKTHKLACYDHIKQPCFLHYSFCMD